MTETLREPNELAQELFAPLAETYDRYAFLLSFGQDARWRRFLVDRVTAGPEERTRLWPQLVELYADFENYQSWTEREIPVVVLKPR